MKALYYPHYKNPSYKDTGRIVIYENAIEIDKKLDFDELISKMAQSNGFDREDANLNAMRLFYAKESGILIISQNKDEDEEKFLKNRGFYLNLIVKNFPR